MTVTALKREMWLLLSGMMRCSDVTACLWVSVNRRQDVRICHFFLQARDVSFDDVKLKRPKRMKGHPLEG